MSAATSIVLVLIGAALVVGSGALAIRGVSPREETVFRAVNGLSDAWLVPIFVPMQFGTYITTPVLAVVAWLTGRRAEAVTLFAAGTASWLLAKVVKEVAERGRPQHALEAQVALRGPKEGGSGFPSGHAATSTALAVVLGVALGGWWVPVLVALTVLTWVGRIYVGVHLPLDIVGGAGLGVAVAGLTTLIADIV